MSHKKTHFVAITTVGILIALSIGAIRYTYPSFLSSSAVEASIVASDTGENRLQSMRLERESLTIEKKAKIEDYTATR